MAVAEKSITFPPRFPNRIQIGHAPDRIPEFFRSPRIEGFAHSLRIPALKRIQVPGSSRARESEELLAAPSAESSATALDVQLTEWTAYFASIACASHNWLSGQVTLPWFKSSDFAAAESSW